MLSCVSLVVGSACDRSESERVPATKNVRLVMDVKSSLSDNDFSYYIFDSSGSAVSSGQGTSDGAGVFLLEGTYDIYGFSGARGLPVSPCSPQELHSCKTYLTDNRSDRSVASGALLNVRVENECELVLPMRHLISMITASFTNLLRDESLQKVPIIISSIFLANVAGENNLGLDAVPGATGIWYNKMGKCTSEADMLVSSPELNIEVCYGDTVEPETVLYAYPNDSPEPSDRSIWCERPTRLVFEACISGDTYYYPVTFSDIRPGRHYHVDFTATIPGLEDTETDPLSVGLTGAVVTVSDWTDWGTEDEIF